MADYILSCCSTADLSKEHFDSREIHYICFHFMLDGVDYPDDLGVSVPFDEFYRRMAEGSDTRTSQVNVSEYVEYFTPFLEAGKDVLHVSLSGGLEAHKLDVHHWFFSTDLTFYIKGGRVSKTAGFIGTILGICPLLNMDDKGRLIPREKIRTKKRVIREIVDKMEQFAEGGLDYSGKCYISESACMEDAKAVAALVEARFPHLNGKVEINSIGTTIGSHTGPGTVALFFFGTPRRD